MNYFGPPLWVASAFYSFWQVVSFNSFCGTISYNMITLRETIFSKLENLPYRAQTQPQHPA